MAMFGAQKPQTSFTLEVNPYGDSLATQATSGHKRMQDWVAHIGYQARLEKWTFESVQYELPYCQRLANYILAALSSSR